MDRGSASVADRDQPLRALQHANRVRSARARMKRAIAAGELSVAEVIVECPPYVETMAIADLLMCQRHWGETRCRRLLAEVGVSERRPVGSLTQRQRLVLAAMLGLQGTAGSGRQLRSRAAGAQVGPFSVAGRPAASGGVSS